LHFWIGSFCRVLDRDVPLFPRGVIGISDVIRLTEDMGNQISDKSWMLYLLEIFNKQNMAVELNLICQFDNQDYFEAVFQGVNQYRFKHIVPIVGHSYLRQIILNYQSRSIKFILTDQNKRESETFDLSLLNMQFAFEGSNQFSGIEWWNKIGNFPFPIRYHVEISQLLYGLGDPSDSESVTYRPYNALIPNKEGSNIQYPISFHNVRIKKEDGCICYNIASGNCNTGLRYNC
jgi:hypothetical protein